MVSDYTVDVTLIHVLGLLENQAGLTGSEVFFNFNSCVHGLILSWFTVQLNQQLTLTIHSYLTFH